MRLNRICVALGLAVVMGCVAPSDESPTSAQPPDRKDSEAPKGEIKRVEFKKNLVIEVQGEKENQQRRIRIQAEVCLREGMLEQLLTKKRLKEHEAILAADIDVGDLHTALLLTGADAGKTVQFRPKLVAPSGTAIKIFLEYKDKNDKLVRVPAQQWIRNFKTKKDFNSDWVFAGSILIPDPLDAKKKPYYGANDGDVITVVNFESACIDVPFLSTKDNSDLDFEAHTERIPPLKTPVTVILEPVVAKKKKN
jgi:hypothetical protein